VIALLRSRRSNNCLIHTSLFFLPRTAARMARAGWTEEMTMTDALTPRAPGQVRGRPFEKGRSGNPLGRRVGCRNRTTIAAAALIAGEAEALTRTADIAAAMKAGGVITPAEAATIAAVVDTFVRALETSDFERRLRLVEAEYFNQPGEAVGVNGVGPNGYYYNP
jgi:hypothetical protein